MAAASLRPSAGAGAGPGERRRATTSAPEEGLTSTEARACTRMAAAVTARSSDGRAERQHPIETTRWAFRQQPTLARLALAGVSGNTFVASIVVTGPICKRAWTFTVHDNGTGVAADDSPSAWWVKPTRRTMFIAYVGGTAPNTRTRAAKITGPDDEWDRRSPIARPTAYSNCWTGAATKVDFTTAATAHDAANQAVRVISAATST